MIKSYFTVFCLVFGRNALISGLRSSLYPQIDLPMIWCLTWKSPTEIGKMLVNWEILKATFFYINTYSFLGMPLSTTPRLLRLWSRSFPSPAFRLWSFARRTGASSPKTEGQSSKTKVHPQQRTGLLPKSLFKKHKKIFMKTGKKNLFFSVICLCWFISLGEYHFIEKQYKTFC